ncbi:MAG: signal peptidase II [Gammaproteobacteria bacterium]|nr:signal peptidase II [Gammaproteobacteria bacterium]
MLRLLWISAVIIVLDQVTKYWASADLAYLIPVEILPFFNLTLAHNTGAAFNFLSDAGGWQRWFFIVLAVIVSGVLIQWVRKLNESEKVEAIGLVLIIGGALGNVWDRMAHGYVVDFIQLHYAGYYFPTFNIADMAISIGAVLLIIESFRAAKKEKA